MGELSEMVGEPVWIQKELSNGDVSGQWVINGLKDFGDDIGETPKLEAFEDGYIAYRHKPEGDKK